MTRSYDMTNRGRAATLTRQRVVSVAESLLRERPVSEVTLPVIAAGAEVSVQTVLRHFGSRDGCLAAVAERVRDRVAKQREGLPAGDRSAAIAALVAHYEAEGQLVVHLLAEAATDEWAAAFVQYGMAYHRSWVGRYLAAGREHDSTDIDALVAATDLMVWKLLRLDLGRSPAHVAAVMSRLVDGIEELR